MTTSLSGVICGRGPRCSACHDGIWGFRLLLPENQKVYLEEENTMSKIADLSDFIKGGRYIHPPFFQDFTGSV